MWEVLGCHMLAASVSLGSPPSPVPTVGTRAPRCPLHHDAPALPGHGSQTVEWFKHSQTWGSTQDMLRVPRQIFLQFSPPFSCASHLSLLLLLTLPTFSPLHHSLRLCLLSPGWGSGHQDTTATFPQSPLGGTGVGRGHPGHRGITCTRCYPRITEAAQEMTRIPVFPMGYRG